MIFFRVHHMIEDTGVTESNILEYLGIIEQVRILHFNSYHNININSHYLFEKKSMFIMQDNILKTKLLGNKKTTKDQLEPMPFQAKDTVPKIGIDLPTTDDFDSEDESDEDSDERPLTRLELQQKTWRGMKVGIYPPHSNDI